MILFCVQQKGQIIIFILANDLQNKKIACPLHVLTTALCLSSFLQSYTYKEGVREARGEKRLDRYTHGGVCRHTDSRIEPSPSRNLCLLLVGLSLFQITLSKLELVLNYCWKSQNPPNQLCLSHSPLASPSTFPSFGTELQFYLPRLCKIASFLRFPVAFPRICRCV